MSTMTIKLVKRPGQYNHDFFFRDAVARYISHNLLDEVIQMHEDIVQPWQESKDKPNFTAEIDTEPNKVIFQVLMTAESAESATLSVWQLLNREEGTAVRPMHLSHDWISKTDPSSPLVSGQGRGHTTGIWLPYDEGIEGRQFDVAVAEHLKPVADQAMRFAIEGSLDKYFNG